MEAKAIKKPPQKKNKKMMPKMNPTLVPKGSQNGAKIVKSDVLEAPCFKGGFQEASRTPPGSILERVWDHAGTIVESFSNTCLVLFACALQQHLTNGSIRNHKESSQECSRELPRNSFPFRVISD